MSLTYWTDFHNKCRQAHITPVITYVGTDGRGGAGILPPWVATIQSKPLSMFHIDH